MVNGMQRPTDADTQNIRVKTSAAGGRQHGNGTCACDVLYRVVVGDVQSVVQPVDGQLQSGAVVVSGGLVDDHSGLLGHSPSTSPSAADHWPCTSRVEGDPVNSVT